jgi:hypothetical protein
MGSKSKRVYPFADSKPFTKPKSARAARKLEEKRRKIADKWNANPTRQKMAALAAPEVTTTPKG